MVPESRKNWPLVLSALSEAGKSRTCVRPIQRAKRGYYETAVDCLLEMPDQDRDERMLGSAYTNLTSCLTMLHQYSAAEAAWKEAQRYTLQPGADAAAAILYAAMGDAEKVAVHMERLEKSYPAYAARTREMTRQILSGTHPAFPVKMKRKRLKNTGGQLEIKLPPVF